MGQEGSAWAFGLGATLSTGVWGVCRAGLEKTLGPARSPPPPAGPPHADGWAASPQRARYKLMLLRLSGDSEMS